MFARFRFLFCAALLLFSTACPAPPRKVTPLASLPEPKAATPIETPLAETPKPPATSPAAAAQPAYPNGWVSLRDWTFRNQIPAPLVTFSAAATNVELRGPAGSLTMDAFRRFARWNGMLVGIAYPPQFTRDGALLHGIDLAKAVEPLLLTNGFQRKNGGVLVLDPGHGGENPGARSRNPRLLEKDLTLDWARRVERLLQGSQWRVLLTRVDDADVSLLDRAAFADREKADLFISLHFNSMPNGAAESGIETYCLTPQGMGSHLLREFEDDANKAFPNNRYDAENLLLACDLHRALLKNTNARDRGVRRARFMTVLREQNRPAALLEGGFLSNPEEARLIGTPDYRQRLAEAVAEALGVPPPVLTSRAP